VALHARTAAQRYSGSADWNQIAALKQAVTTIPVLGNGDIFEAEDARAMMAATGCDGVVIGRGCLGRPWLFAELSAAFTGAPLPVAPTLGEVADIVRRHARLLTGHFGEDKGMRDVRKHVAWYLHGFPAGSDLRRSLALVGSLGELDDLLSQLDPDVPFPPAAGGARGALLSAAEISEQILYVMAVLMGHHVFLSQRPAAGSELSLEHLEKIGVEVGGLIGRAVKRSDVATGRSAAGLHLALEQSHLGWFIAPQ
jgi:hypothetical protein